MTCCDTNHPNETMLEHALWAEEDRRTSAPRPAAALRTLDRVAEALGIATALLQPRTPELPPDGPANLMEASTLLQAFVRISDPRTRLQCLAFVQAAATEAGQA